MTSLTTNAVGVSAKSSSPCHARSPLRADRLHADHIAIVSHELRNALGVVRNAARLLRLQVSAEGVERARVLIERQVGLMNRHVEDLLTTSPDGRPRELQLACVDLRVVLRNATDATALDFARRGHRFALSLPADAVWVLADGTRIEQVFSNLLINAGKYTRDGGDISLVLDAHEGRARVRIRDSGIGIAASQLARIFELFVQVDAAAPRSEGGRGIGLAVVRDLVGLHGGAVTAASDGPDCGS